MLCVQCSELQKAEADGSTNVHQINFTVQQGAQPTLPPASFGAQPRWGRAAEARSSKCSLLFIPFLNAPPSHKLGVADVAAARRALVDKAGAALRHARHEGVGAAARQPQQLHLWEEGPKQQLPVKTMRANTWQGISFKSRQCKLH